MRIHRALAAVLGLALCACAGVARPGVPTLYRGHYTFGFEVSEFRPCGSDERWWVTNGDWREKLNNPQYNEHYLEVEGVVSERGRYGHRGAYDRELEIRELRLSDGPRKAC